MSIPNELKPKKKLYRSRNRMLCGVCGGIAEYFSVDPTIVRIITAVIALTGVGAGLIAYIIAAIIMPDNPEDADL